MKGVKVQASTLMQRRTAVMSRRDGQGEEFGPFLQNTVRNILVSIEDKVARTALTAMLNRLYLLF